MGCVLPRWVPLSNHSLAEALRSPPHTHITGVPATRVFNVMGVREEILRIFWGESSVHLTTFSETCIASSLLMGYRDGQRPS